MSFQQYIKVVIYFLILTELTSFLLSFVLWSFQVLGKDLMDYGIRSGKSLSLGMPKAPQGNIQGRPKLLSLGMPQMASPISSIIHRYVLGAIFLFITWYEFCLEHRVLYESLLCLLFSLPQSSLLDTPFDRDAHLFMIC